MKVPEKSILTLAVGKQVYVNMAIALARSFRVWHRKSDIRFYIATDNLSLYPTDLLDWVNFIKLEKGELGEGFSPKLHLDKLAPTQKTLFIDSDCLILGDLNFVFDRFNGKSVSVVGGHISDGEWFGDIKSICLKFNVDKLPKFNGGIYYLEKGEESARIYAKARELEPQYDSIGFTRLRNRPNDEVLMALAMALTNQTPIEDDGSIMSDPQACQGGYQLNAVKGKSLLINPPLPDKRHQVWYPFHQVSPVVVHFLGYYTQHEPYKREELILKLIQAHHFTYPVAKIWALIAISIPMDIKKKLIDTFRPLYHLIFGYRKVKASKRI